MRIIFFSHYYPPEVNAPASRTSEHCREWARAGHDVTVITSAPNHPKGAIYPGYKNKLFQTETMDGVKVVRVWTYLAANEGFAHRTANYASYMVTAVLAALRIPRPDVYLSTSPQFFCGLGGMLAAKLRCRPWVFEVRDLWPESIVSVGAMRRGIVVRALERLERMAYRNADLIVSVTDSFVPHIAGRCQGAEKIEVIKNGVDLSLFKSGTGPEAVKREVGLEGRFVAAYVGTHGMAHGLDTLLDAAAILKNDPSIGFLMVGDGAEQARLAARVAAEGLDNVRVLGQLPKARMPGIWAATDASLILLKRSDTFRKVLPSKTFEAMAMETPIVLGVEGEAKELLEAAGAGVSITPESAEELAAAIVRLRNDPEEAFVLGRQGAAFVHKHFDRGKLARRYVEVVEAVVEERYASVRRSAAASGTEAA